MMKKRKKEKGKEAGKCFTANTLSSEIFSILYCRPQIFPILSVRSVNFSLEIFSFARAFSAGFLISGIYRVLS